MYGVTTDTKRHVTISIIDLLSYALMSSGITCRYLLSHHQGFYNLKIFNDYSQSTVFFINN